MPFNDFFRSIFGIPNNRPLDPHSGLGGQEHQGSGNHPFSDSPNHRHGEFPGSFFFSFGPGFGHGSHPGFDHGSHPGFNRSDDAPPRDEHDPYMGPSPFDHFGGRSGDVNDMFRHFEDMFRSFDDVFRQMGVAEFPAFNPGAPAIGAAPGGHDEKLSPRDSMLKEPDSNGHHDNRPGSAGAGELRPVTPYRQPATSDTDRPSPSPPVGPFSSSPFSWFFSSVPRDSQPPVMPQDPLDSDLDDEVRRGDLLDILTPDSRKKTPFSGVRIIEPREKQLPDGHIKSVRVYTYRSADGKVEERRTVEDGYGNKETTVTRILDDQSHSVTTRREGGGDEEVIQHYQNMDENDKRDFDARWKQTPQFSDPFASHNKTDNIFDLFRKGFPGFPSTKS